MFIEEKMRIRATDDDNKTYTGSVYRIVIQPCEDDDNRPHALMFVSQDKDYIEQDGEFGCASLWVDKLKSIEVLDSNISLSVINTNSNFKGFVLGRRKSGKIIDGEEVNY